MPLATMYVLCKKWLHRCKNVTGFAKGDLLHTINQLLNLTIHNFRLKTPISWTLVKTNIHIG